MLHALRVFEFKIVSVKVLNLQDFEGENKVAKIKRTNIHLLGEYKLHNYMIKIECK